ncbi:MAG: hybrid sensor histidine kinase/response regulator, partial [Chloroflexota bacterium]
VLRNDPQTADIPIIILSIVKDQARGYRLGVDRYLTKPFDTEAVLAEVELLLSRGPSKKKVLVVDEDMSSVKMLSEVLQTQGYSVTEANTGDDLIEKALSIKPDMIIVNATSEDQVKLQSLRFEKGLENVLLFFFQDPSDIEQVSS